MIKSKFLEFMEVGWTDKTEVWNVMSKASGYILGQVKWYGPWRQYCFYPSAQTVFNPTCMEDVCKLIRELMAKRRKS